MGRDATNLAYLVTIVTFILALRFLSNPATARRGNQIGAVGMLIAIAVTFANSKVVSYWEIAVGMVVGGAFGAVAARRVKMTAMPQMVALFNGVGGGAAALISLAEFHNLIGAPGHLPRDISISLALSALIGSISFTGSMVAFAKLQELIQGRPITYPGQKVGNLLLLGACVAAGVVIVAGYEHQWVLGAMGLGAGLFGILFGLPVGVAVMPAYAQRVVVVPGYGMAVAQAQHDVRQLADMLEQKGVRVSYAIHPVAGRMPGHMNVLLAEANVPYPQLKEMDEINPEFPQADVALVVGANDVTNPAARRPGTAISGMPILDVDQAKSIIVIKRSMASGYAGIDNELYVDPKTSMYFADAKKALTELTAAVKTLVG